MVRNLCAVALSDIETTFLSIGSLSNRNIAQYLGEHFEGFRVLLMEIDPDSLVCYKEYWSRIVLPDEEVGGGIYRVYSRQPILKNLSRLYGHGVLDIVKNMRAWDTLDFPKGMTFKEKVVFRERNLESIIGEILEEYGGQAKHSICLVAGIGHEDAIEQIMMKHNIMLERIDAQ